MHGHYSTSTRNISLEEYAASIQASSEGQAIHSSFLWTDSRDVDKQSSSLPHTYKQSVLTCGGITTDSVSSESKADSRDLPNVNRVYVKTEAHSDSRREANKEIKYDRPGKDVEKTDVTRFGEYGKEIHIPDARGDVKTGNNHLNWKDSKDHTRGKKYLEGNTVNVSGTMDSWHVSGNHLHAPNEIGNSEKVQGSKIIDTQKSGMKGEDKSMDKDRKRKDGKFRDWGESKKERCERNANLEAGYNTVDWRDMTKEKSEPDRSDKDAKHQDKEKEWPSEKEKDYHHVKIEPWSEVDNDSSTRRASAKGVKIEDPEQKKLNTSESWKVLSKESVHRKNERESLQNNLDADRPKKVNNIFEKEQEGHINGEDDIEGERETVPHGTPQLRRMSRAKGSPQMYNNENRSRPELSSLIYKVGECMQELMKLWQDYESSRCETVADSNDFPILEIRIPAEYVTATNRQVSGGQLWGTDVYTIDSDLVAVLMHTGYCRPTASPSPVVQELRATIRVLPPQDCYCSTLRNNVRSRAWGSAIGCSYRVEKCCILKKGGGRFELEPCVSHSSTIEPTLAPTVAERTMTTRASASNALRQQRFIREVTIQYNLCNEPWIKYSISVVADKGLKKPMYTSARLKKGEVLYLETHSCRYELCFSGEKIVKGGGGEVVAGDNIMPFDDNGDECVIVDVFRWSLCKKIFPQRVMRALGVPLRLEFVQVLEENIDWEDVQWSQSGVWISGKEYPLARMHFLSP